MKRLAAPVFLIYLMLLPGCQRGLPMIEPSPPAIVQPVEPLPLPPELPMPDMTPLAGRTICIDPGHGGKWPGAISPSNHLRESDVNLEVARDLAALLRDGGAKAVLTRTTDTALGANLSRDLAARSEIANAAGADAFISIHHNADIIRDTEKNALEVFYKLDDDAASLDLAQALTYSLALRLRCNAEAKLLLPGNYKVLRLSERPAVLLESSYMTHPANAALLATKEGCRAEARAIAAGLAEYFALDPPVISLVETRSLDGGRTEQIVCTFSRGLPLDPDSAEIDLPGVQSNSYFTARGNTLECTFSNALPNGVHPALLRVRNRRGAAVTRLVELHVNRPPQVLLIRQEPVDILKNSAGELLIEVHVLDAFGMPVADGTTVALAGEERTAPTQNGTARFYLGSHPDVLTFKSGMAQKDYIPQYGNTKYSTFRTVDIRDDTPIPHVCVGVNGRLAGFTNPQGWFSIVAGKNHVLLEHPGYKALDIRLNTNHPLVGLEPAEAGVLLGKRIALDPAFGGVDAGAIGFGGTRACDINLDVARHLSHLLRNAGALITLTRTSDMAVTNMQRLALIEDAAPHVALSLSFGSPAGSVRLLDRTGHMDQEESSFVGHYPNSPNGQRLAQCLASRLGIRSIQPSVAYLVQQTGCPCVLVQPGSVTCRETERMYRDVAFRRDVAESLFTGMIDYFEPLEK